MSQMERVKLQFLHAFHRRVIAMRQPRDWTLTFESPLLQEQPNSVQPASSASKLYNTKDDHSLNPAHLIYHFIGIFNNKTVLKH